MRWVGRFSVLVGFLLFVAVGTLGYWGHLAAHGRDLALLNRAVTHFGHLVEGQRTDSLVLDVAIDPESGDLTGTARLSLRAEVEGRRRLYFLLGDALRLTAFSVPGFPEARAWKLWLVTLVDLGRPVAEGTPLEVTLAYEGRPASGLFGLGTARVSPRDVQLSVDSFWFPNDLQGQFQADVAVTLPSYLTLVHAGEEVDRASLGRVRRWRWRTSRPVPSLSLVAGMYRAWDLDTPNTRYRLYLADDVHLDSARVLAIAARADGILSARYGPSGYSNLSLFVSRRLRRAYNDGAGVMGLSIRYFRRGDYGFDIIAHELAHNWFGATVMEQWLRPGTGGEWLVEGFSEMSSMLAAEEVFGQPALVRRLAQNFYDPRRDGVVGAMSVLDNAVGDDGAREVIYNKGGYVAMMLRRLLGDDVFFPAVRDFIDSYRHRSATEADLQAHLADASGRPLDAFFEQWVRSKAELDLALEQPEDEMHLALTNLGTANAIGGVAVAAPPESSAGETPPAPALAADEEVEEEEEEEGGEAGGATPLAPTPTPAAAPAGGAVIGATLPLPPPGGSAVADPDLTWADMRRENNLFPRTRFPLALAVGEGGLAEVRGETYPWSPATLRVVSPGGAERGSWELAANVVSYPRWLDRDRLVLNTTDADSRSAKVVLFDARDGEQRVIGRGSGPVPSQGAVYAVQGDRIVRWQGPAWAREEVVRHPRRALGALAPSPDGQRLAYVSARDNDMEIRLLELAGRHQRMLVSWDRDLRDLVWSGDGTRLYAGIGGNWDWQVWEIPADGSAVRILAREAAAMGNLAMSPDGMLLAFTAAAELDYPFNRREIVVLDPANRVVERFAVAGSDARQVVWSDDETLLAVAAPTADFTLPQRRNIVRLSLEDGELTVE